MAVKREHTLAVTWGRWSGFYIAGKRKYLLRTDTLFALRHRVERALWDDGDVGEADRALFELFDRAEAYEKALRYMAEYLMTGTEQTLHIDFQGKAREALRG